MDLTNLGEKTLRSESLDHLIGHVRYGVSPDGTTLKVMPVTEYASSQIGQYLEFLIKENKMTQFNFTHVVTKSYSITFETDLNEDRAQEVMQTLISYHGELDKEDTTETLEKFVNDEPTFFEGFSPDELEQIKRSKLVSVEPDGISDSFIDLA